jgi:hypothetical protein
LLLVPVYSLQCPSLHATFQLIRVGGIDGQIRANFSSFFLIKNYKLKNPQKFNACFRIKFKKKRERIDFCPT